VRATAAGILNFKLSKSTSRVGALARLPRAAGRSIKRRALVTPA